MCLLTQFAVGHVVEEEQRSHGSARGVACQQNVLGLPAPEFYVVLNALRDSDGEGLCLREQRGVGEKSRSVRHTGVLIQVSIRITQRHRKQLTIKFRVSLGGSAALITWSMLLELPRTATTSTGRSSLGSAPAASVTSVDVQAVTPSPRDGVSTTSLRTEYRETSITSPAAQFHAKETSSAAARELEGVLVKRTPRSEDGMAVPLPFRTRVLLVDF